MIRLQGTVVSTLFYQKVVGKTIKTGTVFTSLGNVRGRPSVAEVVKRSTLGMSPAKKASLRICCMQ